MFIDKAKIVVSSGKGGDAAKAETDTSHSEERNTCLREVLTAATAATEAA